MRCLFCDIATSRVNNPGPEDMVLAESESFVVKPGLGQFALGYSLICSRRHVPNMAALSISELDELEVVAGVFSKRLEAMTGKRVVRFEHGTCSSTHAGSCLDHAHLHLLPMPADVDPAVTVRAACERVDRLRDLRRFAERESSYLYIESSATDRCAFVIHESLPSQYMRRTYCDRLGMSDFWDWAVFPFAQKIREFISMYDQCSTGQAWKKHICAAGRQRDSVSFQREPTSRRECDQVGGGRVVAENGREDSPSIRRRM